MVGVARVTLPRWHAVADRGGKDAGHYGSAVNGDAAEAATFSEGLEVAALQRQ